MKTFSLPAAAALCTALLLCMGGCAPAPAPLATPEPSGEDAPPVVTVREDIQVELAEGWMWKAESDTGIQWYQVEPGISTCFQLAVRETEEPPEEWVEQFLPDYRDYLLKTFVETPETEFCPFLEVLNPSETYAPGTDYLTAEGWGVSYSGSKNHFLVVLLPERQCALTIHTSSWSRDWDRMQEYAQWWVWPILNGLVLTAPATEKR